MQTSALISNPEFLECTETENIADYLLKHRVISDSQYNDIINEKTLKDKNMKLLQLIQDNPNEDLKEINVFGLFVNALRSSGCHTLASLMDVFDEPLVSPVSRRRGQISLVIQVSALQVKIKSIVNKKSVFELNSGNDENGLIWVQNSPYKNDDFSVKPRKKRKKFRPLCFFCCRVKNKTNHDTESNIKMNLELEVKNRHKQKQTNVNNQIDEIRRRKIDILTEKSILFYSYLALEDTKEWENCVKYFEQTHKILVFDRNYDDSAMFITLICTKSDNLSTLNNLLNQGVLEKDVSKIVLSSTLLDKLGVKNLKLSISVFQDEYLTAKEELTTRKLHNRNVVSA